MLSEFADFVVKELRVPPMTLHPTPEDLDQVFRRRFGDPNLTGPLPRLWHRLGYFTPDIYYEALVARLVTDGTAWLDVGCGRYLFPGNEQLADILARRCSRLVGVDPDPTIHDNPFVQHRVQCSIESFTSSEPFDVVTLRMVAEHVTRPHEVIAALARLTRPGSKVVVYTINRWSPVSLVAWATPCSFHHWAKAILWKTEEADTFPVAYRMNTRSTLRKLFAAHGFHEMSFAYLSDCRTFYRFRPLHYMELALWWSMSQVHLAYPENCMLAVFERLSPDIASSRETGQ
jgi:SAM-dependent methyltransferase